MWMMPAAFGLVGGLGLLVAAVIVYSSQVSKAAPTAAAPVTSPPSPAATSTTPPSAASTTPGAALSTGRPVLGGWRKGRSGPIRVHPVAVPLCAQWADESPPFSTGTGDDPASLHFARGYDVTYDSNDASDSIEVTLFQFATPADAAAFKADFVSGGPGKLKADPVIPGADDYNSNIPRSGHIHPRRDRDQRQPGVRDRRHKRQRRSGTPGGDDGAPAVCRALTSCGGPGRMPLSAGPLRIRGTAYCLPTV